MVSIRGQTHERRPMGLTPKPSTFTFQTGRKESAEVLQAVGFLFEGYEEELCFGFSTTAIPSQ